jgi:hypothetical protein
MRSGKCSAKATVATLRCMNDPTSGGSPGVAAGRICSHSPNTHVAAWPSFSMYERFAHALGWETNNAISKVYSVEGPCVMLAPCAVISQETVDEMCDTEDK